MSLIPCTFDCIYQNGGECFLDRAVSAGKQNSGGCAYYIRKAKDTKKRIANKSHPDD